MHDGTTTTHEDEGEGARSEEVELERNRIESRFPRFVLNKSHDEVIIFHFVIIFLSGRHGLLTQCSVGKLGFGILVQYCMRSN